MPESHPSSPSKRIWIDLDNSPHVLFFAPIIAELEKAGHAVTVTARDFSQTVELARSHGLDVTVIGKHSGSGNVFRKVTNTMGRALNLAWAMRGRKLACGVSHGSRGLVIAARLLGVPAMTIYDYEFASYRVFNMLSQRLLAPEVIPEESLTRQGLDPAKLVRYPGLKEEAYVYSFRPKEDVLQELGLDPRKPVVTVRPPAAWAHYHHDSSEALFMALLKRLDREKDAQVVILARTASQAEEIRSAHQLDAKRFQVMSHAIDGLSLMWFSQAVFSGGGTMVREAALLGMNVYSFFGGAMGAGDRSLVESGRLKLIPSVADVEGIVIPPPGTNRAVPADTKYLAQYIAREIASFCSACEEH